VQTELGPTFARSFSLSHSDSEEATHFLVTSLILQMKWSQSSRSFMAATSASMFASMQLTPRISRELLVRS